MTAPATPAPATRAGGDVGTAGSGADRAQLARCYRFGHGFSYRREAFGGILYHYEGVQPDPRVTFVDNGFLLDLLDALAAHPQAALRELLDAVQVRFDLSAAECARLESFFATLIQRGALVPV